jgi:hypothetical protein
LLKWVASRHLRWCLRNSISSNLQYYSPKLVKMSGVTTFEVTFEKLYLLQSPILLPKTC